VPARHRSQFIAQSSQGASSEIEGSDNDPLYQAALAVEQDEKLGAEMAEWEEATLSDGMADDLGKKRP